MGPLCSLTVHFGGRETEQWLAQASRREMVVLVVPRGEEGSRVRICPAHTLKSQNHQPNEWLLFMPLIVGPFVMMQNLTDTSPPLLFQWLILKRAQFPAPQISELEFSET